MKGPAGVGKSALAQTCAEMLEEKLGAAFFFSRYNGRDNPNRLFTSLAHQLSARSQPYYNILDDKIHHNRTLVTKSMPRQFDELISQPLRDLWRQGVGMGDMVIIIDGLDECNSKEAQCEIIEIIAKSVRERTTPFRWAFFSRPESHIQSTFAVSKIALFCQQATLPISREVDGEIELYLRDGFRRILRQHNLSTVAEWPPNKVIRRLVDAAAGLFIYAATILRFVGQPDSFGPEVQLQAVLAVISDRRGTASSAHPFAELDAFYTLIMKTIPDTILPSIQLLLFATTVIRGDGTRWCAQKLGNILGLSEVSFRAACNKLCAVAWLQGQKNGQKSMAIQSSVDQTQPLTPSSSSAGYDEMRAVTRGQGGYFSFYHKSFNDFLSDQSRSGPFCAQTSTLANEMFQRCLGIHNNYVKSYIYDQKLNSLTLAPGIRDSAASLPWPTEIERINAFLKIVVYHQTIRTMLLLHCSYNLDHQLSQQLLNLDYCRMLHLERQYHYKTSSYITSYWVELGVDQQLLEKEPKNLFCPYSPSISSRLFSLVGQKPWRDDDIRFVIGKGNKKVFVCRDESGGTYFVATRPVEKW